MTEPERQRLFNELYSQYEKRVFAYCVYVTGDKDQASDIFQEVFIKAYRSLHTIRESDKTANWLFRIARNECLNSLKVSQRNEQRNVDIEETYDSDQLATPPAAYTGENEILRTARSAPVGRIRGIFPQGNCRYDWSDTFERESAYT